MRGWRLAFTAGGARFFAAAVARAVELSTVRHMLMEGGEFTANIQGALEYLGTHITRLSPFKGIVGANDSTAIPLGRALLSEFGRGRDEDCRTLAGLFKSKHDLRKAIDAVLADQIGVSNLRDVAFGFDEED